MRETTIEHKGPVKIIEMQSWDWEDVRKMCIDHDYYTRGTCADYEGLMGLVEGLEPTTYNILRVAQNIANHSVNNDGEADPEMIMFYLANDVVMRAFEF